MEKKITKREMFVAIAEKYALTEEEREFIEKEIAALDRKAVKAKEAAAKKKEEADELMEAVQAVLTHDFQTLGDIAAQIEGEDVSVAKITSRMTKLVKAQIAVKEDISVVGEDGKKSKKKAYKLADCNCETCAADVE